MTNDELLRQTNIQKISDEGQKIYEEIKGQFEPAQQGKFLAIDIGSKTFFFGDSSVDAVEVARKAHPNTVFYVVKIGHSVAETLAQLASKMGLLKRFQYLLSIDCRNDRWTLQT